jgi:hypothetical protein
MSTQRKLVSASLLALAFVCSSCTVLRDVQKSLTNLAHCKFKIENVTDCSLLGVDLSGKSRVTVADGLKLLPAFTERRMPAAFTLNVSAVNPNDGSDGTPSTTATLRSLAWTLLIDSVQTISGTVNGPLTLPGTGQATVIPIRMELDLYRFFSRRGYDGIINLALAIGGMNRTASRVQLRARPTIDTPLGTISPRGEITIVDSEFRAK